MKNQDLYIPQQALISSVRRESEMVKTYAMKIKRVFKPGQFLQVSVLGVGEAPISMSSSPLESDSIELTIRDTGKVTHAICSLARGDSLGLRGPFGNFFPIEDAAGRDVVIVAGGIGLAPLRPLIKYILDNRKRYGRVYLLYGARTKNDMIFKDDLTEWQKRKDFNVLLTVDREEEGWKDNVGMVTTLFDRITYDLHKAVAFICGPPVMIRYTAFGLLERGVDGADIFLSLERYMKCGVGKCGHCYINNRYVCTDGPVFSFDEIRNMRPEEVMA